MYLGPRAALKIQDEVNLVSQVFYFGMSTGMGRQTLGEEYCDVVQVDGKRLIPPAALQRFMLIFWHVLVPYIFSKLSGYIDRFLRPRVQTLQGKEALKEETRKKLSAWLPHLKSMLEVVQRLHIAVFYFSGIFYHVSKRITNIQYVRSRLIATQQSCRIQLTHLGFFSP